MLFCDVELAQRIERAETGLIGAATHAAARRGAPGVTVPVAGGLACYADADSPMNKVVGLGFDGLPDAGVLDEIERVFGGHAAPVGVELSTLADPGIAPLLCDRGYRLVGFENVLGCALPAVTDVLAGVRVRPADAGENRAWVDVVVEGFAHPDGEGVPSHEHFPRAAVADAMDDMERAGAVRYVALFDDAVAGGASMRIADGVAQLTGAATAPAFRRRGVQAALLAHRLRAASDAGCDVAVVTTAPGSLSQKNVQRMGFHLLYTRAVLIRDTAKC
ncbi:GNAT family N-acetyltransferase [Mycolicibacterium sp. 018/SC-01/001]|uniref:GNAT family N-acetyltransferase n=1 Tax=Mycolicibacterium sp. 018/SC-01/001 TaxID=2592069 RepID=UPI00117CE75E|nr:GNAT family N-acetyltransferase [Mycolicibacterium sp. 018/SC-01/001]TRW78421.1 GNAT family N-acetyltransferase [Mycolicibacterium sp. 018/SC-01/001]